MGSKPTTSKANFRVSDLQVEGLNRSRLRLVREINLPQEGKFLRFLGRSGGWIDIECDLSERVYFLGSFAAKGVVRDAYAIVQVIIDGLLRNEVITQDDVRFIRPKIRQALQSMIRDMSKTQLPISPLIKSE